MELGRKQGKTVLLQLVSGELKYLKQAENASSLPLPASQLLAQRDIKQTSAPNSFLLSVQYRFLMI